MTGYGCGSFDQGSNQVNIELKSVNSRYLDYKIRGCTISPIIENKIKDILKRDVERGFIQIKIEVVVNKLDSLVFNKKHFESIINVINKINDEYNQKIILSEIIALSDIIVKNDNIELDQKKFIHAFNKAILELNHMRCVEGELIGLDIIGRIKKLKIYLNKVKTISKKYFKKRQKQMENNLQRLLNVNDLDDYRILQEVAILSEKVDVTEEITRCDIHINQLKTFIKKNEPIGKKINFLLQEINREVNTIGSKNSEVEIIKNIIEMKSEIEKIREQNQNIS